MAEVYDHLSLKQDSRLVNMRYFLNNVVEKVFDSLASAGPIAFQVVCEEVSLPSQQALAVGIITNELVTNALKYAFQGDKPGQVAVTLSTSDDIELSICDNGVGLRGEADPGGSGSRIVLLLTQQLDGQLTYERLDIGLRVILRAHPR